MLYVDPTIIASLPFDLAAEVEAYKNARVEHSKTVGVPAPIAIHPLVEAIVLQHDGEFTPYPAPASPPTIHDVNRERDRRIVHEFWFQSKPYDNDTVSKQRITGAATLAGFAIAAGAQPGNYLWHGGASSFSWIAKDNTLTVMDAQTCFAFGQAAANHESAMVFAAYALKAMTPIPNDYEDNSYWS